MISAVILCLYTFLCGTPITARAVENNESSGGRVEESATLQLQVYGDEKDVAALSDNVRVSSRLWELLFKKEEKKVVVITSFTLKEFLIFNIRKPSVCRYST